MVPWHIEYFKLKEFEKWQVLGGLSNFSLKQVIKSPVRDAFPIPREKEHPNLQ